MPLTQIFLQTRLLSFAEGIPHKNTKLWRIITNHSYLGL